MTMAPEPGTRMVWISLRFILHSAFFIHHFKELSKNIMRIVRTRRSFRMELHTEDRFMFHPQTFKRVIVQTLVSDFHLILVQVTFGDTVIMILCGNEYFAIWQVLHRMIPAMM